MEFGGWCCLSVERLGWETRKGIRWENQIEYSLSGHGEDASGSIRVREGLIILCYFTKDGP